MDLKIWQKNKQVLLMIPITISKERASKIIPKNILVSVLPTYKDEAFFLITHPTTDLPDQPLCHSLVAPFLDFKTVTWILGVPSCESTLYKQAVFITDTFTPNGEFENDTIICVTNDVNKLKEGLDYNMCKIFRVYIKYENVFEYVKKTNRLYDHFLKTSSIIYPGINNSIIVNDRS